MISLKNDLLVDALLSFFKSSDLKKAPLLLAFSGGPDSLALLYALLSCPLVKQGEIKFALAHVDHGWREESREEALKLKALALSLDLTFHLKELNPSLLKGNLECASRDARFAFFRDLSREYGYQAVLLGHHADDLAETVLKRTLEGVALPYLSGMTPIAQHGELNLWRPFLHIRKNTILSWLKMRGLKWIDDRTNQDVKYLRARMRAEIIPSLNASFGKDVVLNLCHLSKEAALLRSFLDDLIQPYLKLMAVSPFGSWLDLSSHMPPSVYETRYLIKRIAEMEGVILSRDALDKVATHLMEGSANKKILAQGLTLEIDRKCLFMLKDALCPWEHSYPVSKDLSLLDNAYCKFDVALLDEVDLAAKNSLSNDWKKAFNGILEVIVPEGDYVLSKGHPTDRFYNGDSLSKWWTDHRVPAFMRPLFPVLKSNDDVVVHEFLSGKSSFKTDLSYKKIKISIFFLSLRG